ncbi:hypothetical protein CKO_02619 [Citrobacter koseri ATCC BAA-895]|uniref:Uncharacterized protein n=1 Tax=Citrobacter koseri (strain ATCC BAA-895 / CDC 4225-83 / SGSC4696) TaxID=290338 RepID=A8AJR3_CITK8|nr:hypothetical protein CKO_02619 [Citrobacter koseri ATCC BAA-895]
MFEMAILFFYGDTQHKKYPEQLGSGEEIVSKRINFLNTFILKMPLYAGRVLTR